ncbi:MAG: rhomboid family intramembrane serine protease [Pseudomonadota bacterium]
MFIPLHDVNKLKNIRLQWVTLTLIVANVVIWMLTAGAEVVGDAGLTPYASLGFTPVVVFDGVPNSVPWLWVPEWAIFITYAFLHGGFWHLAGNMAFLWVFGDNVEDAMGHFKFLIFYLACAAAGAFAHGLLDTTSQVPLIGASAAVSGLVSAYLILHPKVWVWVLVLMRFPIMLPAWVLLGFWIGFQVFQLVTMPDGNVSFASHIGGLIAGALLVPLLKRRSQPLLDTRIETPDSVVLAKQPTKTRRVVVPPIPRKWGRD